MVRLISLAVLALALVAVVVAHPRGTTPKPTTPKPTTTTPKPTPKLSVVENQKIFRLVVDGASKCAGKKLELVCRPATANSFKGMIANLYASASYFNANNQIVKIKIDNFIFPKKNDSAALG